MTRRVCVVTGTRAEFGLLRPVIEALRAEPCFDVRVIAAGAHLLGPSTTIEEVRSAVGVDAIVQMQAQGDTGQLADAAALGRGVEGMAQTLGEMSPDWVLVLGDRIEAFAAACAASVGGVALAHIHGGDRAEGVADEAMRHAITKLAHLHLPATEQSAERIEKMGESPDRIVLCGSPAAIGIEQVEARPVTPKGATGPPRIVVLMHPCGRGVELEYQDARSVHDAVAVEPALLLHPNFDAGREGILRAIAESVGREHVCVLDHVDHGRFREHLKWMGLNSGVLVGNSSAGLIDAALLGCPVVDVGQRQAGRERPGNVVHVDDVTAQSLTAAIQRARALDLSSHVHPYGSGDADRKIACALRERDPHEPGLLRKRNAY